MQKEDFQWDSLNSRNGLCTIRKKQMDTRMQGYSVKEKAHAREKDGKAEKKALKSRGSRDIEESVMLRRYQMGYKACVKTSIAL